MVVHAFNPCPGGRGRQISELEDSLVYRVSSSQDYALLSKHCGAGGEELNWGEELKFLTPIKKKNVTERSEREQPVGAQGSGHQPI